MPKFYNLVLTLLTKLLPITSFFNPKMKSWLADRQKQIVPSDLEKPIWIHAASLGEFEQGRPVIESIKKEWPNKKIALTFFSSSGFSIRKNYEHADWVGYMPFDTAREARSFVQRLNPSMAIFIKYEFWYNHLHALEIASIPFIFISTHWQADYFLLKKSTKWLLEKVLKADRLFVMDASSKPILDNLGYPNYTVAGDTRIDRVLKIKEESFDLSLFTKTSDDRPLFIAGSTWPQDEKILAEVIRTNKDYKWIIVPHDVAPERINDVINTIPDQRIQKYSNWQGEKYDVLIVDRIGILNKLYAKAAVAYIGGGFGKGIHNILEPGVFGIPVLFGPHFGRFKEANDFLKSGLGYSILNASDILAHLAAFNSTKAQEIKSISAQYFKTNSGATDKIIDYLRRRIF